jgi:aminocarboxymuconate-semialdehyde decarboxylase
MKIDIFPHILPPGYKTALENKAAPGFYQQDIIDACPTISDLDMRFRVMDKYGDYVQVLTLVSPPVDSVAKPDDAIELAKLANDEMASIVMKYPDRFLAAVACLPMNDMDSSMKELDRAINELHFRGVQIYTSINGKPLDSPEFFPLYERMIYYDLPIWIHPVRESKVPDYPGEDTSKYYIHSLFGWPYETTAAMTRLIFSGVFERYPKLKIIIHHCDAMVPYFAQRIETWDGIREILGHEYEQHLSKKPLDYYRMFYTDTATYGSTPALMCCYAFCGADHMLFGTDMPYDNQNGFRVLEESIRSVTEMAISNRERNMIFSDNARNLLRLPM